MSLGDVSSPDWPSGTTTMGYTRRLLARTVTVLVQIQPVPLPHDYHRSVKQELPMRIDSHHRNTLNTFAEHVIGLTDENQIVNTENRATSELGDTQLIGHGCGRVCYTLPDYMVPSSHRNSDANKHTDSTFIVKFAHGASVYEEHGMLQNTNEHVTWNQTQSPFLLPVLTAQQESEWPEVERNQFKTSDTNTVTGPLWIVMPLGDAEFEVCEYFWDWVDVVREYCDEFVLESDVRPNNVVKWRDWFRLCDYGIHSRENNESVVVL